MIAQKRQREDPAAPAADSAALLARLSDKNAKAVLGQLLKTSPEARAAIKAAVERLQAKPVNLTHFEGAIMEAVSLLDSMRPSKQYGRFMR
jgi:cytochrome c1